MNNQNSNQTTGAKTASFQMRINPEVKKKAETLYASYGLTLTDAVNIFIQQSLRTNGLPFLMSPENEAYLKGKAMDRLLAEVEKGWQSAEQEGWLTLEEAEERLGIANE